MEVDQTNKSQVGTICNPSQDTCLMYTGNIIYVSGMAAALRGMAYMQ